MKVSTRPSYFEHRLCHNESSDEKAGRETKKDLYKTCMPRFTLGFLAVHLGLKKKLQTRIKYLLFIFMKKKSSSAIFISRGPGMDAF